MNEKFKRASTGVPAIDDNGRIIRYVFSDESVARDNHTIRSDGWQLANFIANPVFLWAHDAGALPIGRVVDIGVVGRKLVGNVEYLSRDEYPFADTVYQLVKKQYLNATSVSWLPLEHKFATERSRPGGIDFIRQELLEVSQVPVPALPSALVAARSAGVDTQPMFEWIERALDSSDFKVVKRADLENLRRAAKMPVKTRSKPAVAIAVQKRGLYSVSELARLVNQLGWIVDESQDESAVEGDASKVPAMLLEALKELGACLVAMTQEEVGELIDGLSTGDDSMLTDDAAQDAYVAAAGTKAQHVLRALEVTSRRSAAAKSGANIKLVENFIRAGRVLSASNEKKLRDAHAQMSDGLAIVLGVCDDAGVEDDGDEGAGDDDAMSAAFRQRKARARALKNKFSNSL